MSPGISSWAGSGYLGTFSSYSSKAYSHQPVLLQGGGSHWGLQLVSDRIDEGSGRQPCLFLASGKISKVSKILAGRILPTWFSSSSVVTPAPFTASFCSASGLTPSSSYTLPVGGTEQDIQLPQRALCTIALGPRQLAGSLQALKRLTSPPVSGKSEIS